MRFSYLLLACLAFAIGCAPPPKLRAPASPNPTSSDDLSQRSHNSQTTDPKSPRAESSEEIDSSLTSTAVPDISDSLATVTQARISSFEDGIDFPVTMNRRVLTWIDEFSGRSRKSFQSSLQRSGRYMPRIREIFREEGVPQDLAFIAHVESGFRYNARSHANAVGLWQFRAGTARDLGLRCDAAVDERLDPEKSTRAAAHYLRNLYEKYDDWHLALAAYNAGPGNVDRAIRNTGSSDYWEITKRGALRTETCNFVPAILAASILSKSPADFGLVEDTDHPVESDVVDVEIPTDLRVIAVCAGCELEELQTLNPALLKHRTPRGKYAVRVPAQLAERTRKQLAAIPPEHRTLYQEHSVKRGDTLGALARKYGTTVRAIQDANDMGKSTLLRSGAVLRIPAGGTTLDAALASRTPLPAAGPWSGTHRVQRGETLHAIARRAGTTAGLLAEHNGIADPSRLKAGQVLRVPSFGPAASPSSEPESSDRPLHAASTPPSSSSLPKVADFFVTDASAQDLAPPLPDNAAGAKNAGATAQPSITAALPGSGSATQLIAAPSPENSAAAEVITTLSDSIPSPPALDPEALGRGPSLAHLVEEARAELAAAPPEPPPPAARSHRVQQGDTLWNIARRHHVTVSDLRRWNRLGSKSTIHPGQVLRLY